MIEDLEPYLYSMKRFPTKLATLVLSNAMEISNTEVAVQRLNSTSVSKNFQNVVGSGTRPTRR